MDLHISSQDLERLRSGWYSDAYFTNIVHILNTLKEEDYTFQNVSTGEIEVEMQIFCRRKPLGIVVGIEEALTVLRECTGYFNSEGLFVNTYHKLEVEAVDEGTVVEYSGNPSEVKPILRIKGQYAHFAMLETPILGVLTESTRLATNVFETLKAVGGKDVLFFPARFSHYFLQGVHGYAYKTAVDVYNRLYNKQCKPYVSTDAQGKFWGGHGGGTTAHAYIAVFLGDTSEMMLQFARILPPEIPRIALVDFHNDCVGEIGKVMEAMFGEYYSLERAGQHETAKRYQLFGVRTDTSGNMVDKSIQPLGDKKLDCGVNARLIWQMKKAVLENYKSWTWLDKEGQEMARQWSEKIKIVATGGFNKERIKDFEELGVPVDIYGVGSSLLANCSNCGTNSDYTADIVRVKIGENWQPMAKEGRQPGYNSQLGKREKKS